MSGEARQSAEVALTAAEREWIAATILDAAGERDTDAAARLIEARVETLIRRRVAPIWAILHAWEAWDGSLGPDGQIHPDSSSPHDRERLRTALTPSASPCPDPTACAVLVPVPPCTSCRSTPPAPPTTDEPPC